MPFTCEALGDGHDTTTFGSGHDALDHWLHTSARASDRRNLTRTYVWHDGDRRVIAYFTLMPFLIEREALGARLGRGLVRQIPSYLLARLALDRSLQGRGLGSQVLASALRRAAAAARSTGGRYVVVDAIDEAAAGFYRHHGFVPIASDDRRLVLPTKVIEPHLGPST